MVGDGSAQDDDLRVQDVHQAGQGGADRAPGPVDQGPAGRVARVSRGADRGRIDRDAVGRQAGQLRCFAGADERRAVTGQGRAGGDALDMAGCALPIARAVELHGDMTDLARGRVWPVDQAPVDHDRAADAGRDGDVDRVLGARPPRHAATRRDGDLCVPLEDRGQARASDSRSASGTRPSRAGSVGEGRSRAGRAVRGTTADRGRRRCAAARRRPYRSAVVVMRSRIPSTPSAGMVGITSRWATVRSGLRWAPPESESRRDRWPGSAHDPRLARGPFYPAGYRSAAERGPAAGRGVVERASAPDLEHLVPHTGQMPCVAGLPFFIVILRSSRIVRLSCT